MPSLGADMDAGTITQWLVKPGDHVHRGDIVAVVDTDKADVDVEIFEDGVIDRILVPEGREGAGRHAIGRAWLPRPPPLRSSRPGRYQSPSPPRPPNRSRSPNRFPHPARNRRPFPSPHRSHSGDLRLNVDEHSRRSCDASPGTSTSISTPSQGSGPDGAITRADIEAAATAGAPVEAPGPRVSRAAEPIERAAPSTHERELAMRDAIARLMARSKREIPHYYLGTDIDFSRARNWLDEANAERPVAERLLPAVLLIKAVALATSDIPGLNGFFVDDRYQAGDAVHVGVAISLRGGGLIAPAIHDADQKSLDRADGAICATSSHAPARDGCAAPRCRDRRSRSPTSASKACGRCTE